MVDENIDLSSNEENNNVLRYIYMLRDHLDNLALIWQGIRIVNKKPKRVSDPYACDSFIFEQINALSNILNPHNFVSNITNEERNNIILDTYSSFLYSMNREPTIEKHKKPMMRESFFNTLMLFLNILRDGAGAQFTLGAQSGIIQDVYQSSKDNAIKPIIDIPKAFGFNKKNNNNNMYNNYNNNRQEVQEDE